MNKAIALNLIMLIATISFIGMINYKSKGVSLTHLNCVTSDSEAIEFNVFYDEKNKILYYADGYTANIGDPSDTTINESKICYRQNRVFNNGYRTPITFFDEIDRHTLKFKRLIELDSSRTLEKPRTGNCQVEMS
jgi:hypothetical protein